MMETSESNITISNPKDRNIVIESLKQNKWLQEINSLSKGVNEKKKQLQSTLDKIEENATPIKEDSYLWGLIESFNAKDSIIAVSDEQRGVNKDIINAIKTTNGFVLHIIHLMKLLANAEVDLYKFIDNNSIDINELKSIFIDYCHEKGISDEDVEKLFEVSFQRAYQLRDRLNNLRDNLIVEIQATNDNVQRVEEKLISMESDITIKLQNKINDELDRINSCFSEFETSALQSEKRLKDLQQKTSEQQENIEKDRDETKLAFEKLNQSLNEDNEAHKKELEGKFDNLATELKMFVNVQLENKFSEISKITDEQNTLIKNLQKKVAELSVKTIFDSLIYKVSVGIIAVGALVCSLLF